jgi:II/X family phage/plasmid replication protein
MLDLLRITIPFCLSAVSCSGSPTSTRQALSDSSIGIVKDVLRYTLDGLPMAAKSVHRDVDGKIVVGNLNHPFESLPTSFTGIAIKLMNDGHCWPHIAMKASPAKILQGHNVYGSVSIEQAAAEFLGCLCQLYETMYSDLAVDLTEVTSLDVTYSARYLPIGSPKTVDFGRDLISFLRTLSAGQLKPSDVFYHDTVYWNKESDYGGLKCYLKHTEFFNQLKEAKTLKRQNDPSADRLLQVMNNQDLQAWSEYLLRFEVSVKKDYLRRNDIPLNLFDLVIYQKNLQAEGRCFLKEIWAKRSAPLFAACEGMTMKIVDDEHVEREIKRVHVRYTKSGKVSYGYANSLMDFYRSVKDYGYPITKERYFVSESGERTFRNRLKALAEAGLSKAYLQTFTLNSQPSNVVPVLRFCVVDFGSQHPPSWVEPVSQFYHPSLFAPRVPQLFSVAA